MSRRVSATGSCARCRRALDLTAVRRGDTWICSAACARGADPGPGRSHSDPRLINRPRRHYGRRRPKELNGT